MSIYINIRPPCPVPVEACGTSLAQRPLDIQDVKKTLLWSSIYVVYTTTGATDTPTSQNLKKPIGFYRFLMKKLIFSCRKPRHPRPSVPLPRHSPKSL